MHSQLLYTYLHIQKRIKKIVIPIITRSHRRLRVENMSVSKGGETVPHLDMDNERGEKARAAPRIGKN